MTKTRLALPALALLAAALVFPGCGGGSSSSSGDLAGFVAPGSLVYVEGTLRPSGELQSNVDSLAQAVGGIDNLGEYVVAKLESSARDDGEPFDYGKEVEPWLGEKAGVSFKSLVDGKLTEPVVVVESTDVAATQEFIDTQAKQSKVPYKDGSYEGVDFKVGGSNGNAIGVVGESLVVSEDGESGFKAAVDASKGESLADEARFKDVISAASDGSLADAYVDVGGLIEASGNGIEPQAQEILENAGIDPSEATVVASVVPGSDQVEIDLSSDLGGEEAPSGDASALIGSLPADSFAALGAAGFGDQVKEAVDKLDEAGIPGQVPPNQLKSTLGSIGIDLDKIATSLKEAAVFAQGNSKDSLGGALVLTSDSNEAAKTVANLGVLLRRTGSPGVTAVTSGGASGFSIHTAELGKKPLVVVAKGDRVAIGYGLAPALQGLSTEGETLSGVASYKAAVSALGDTPISGFVDGARALSLAEALVPPSETGFQKAKRYLKSIEYIAIGTGSDGELATAKLIVGVEE
ncbi:MAG TPA: DUF3352 domain-containing protein [Solirubrobacterales bacterium]|nr:DUF3352 domain-containing protein [Solirubrobacterales bacterium]